MYLYDTQINNYIHRVRVVYVERERERERDRERGGEVRRVHSSFVRSFVSSFVWGR